MSHTARIEGTFLKPEFLSATEASDLYDLLLIQTDWDTRMASRKTASYGVAYNYSQISYPFVVMPPVIASLCNRIAPFTGFTANNCLINFYPDGNSTMGFHSDQIDILEEGTGIAIVSLGETRTLRFKRIGIPSDVIDLELPSGSLFYMTQLVQHEWKHALPEKGTSLGRMSLTFRYIRELQ